MKQETIKHLNYDHNNVAQIKIEKRTQNKSSHYYARYYIPKSKRHLNGSNTYKVESLHTRDEDEAIANAQMRFEAIQSALQQDHILVGKTFSTVYELFLKDYQDRLLAKVDGYSIHMERGFRKSVGNYVVEYLDGLMIDDIRVKHFEDYELWRRSYWINPNAEKKKRLNANKNISANPSRRTIAWELTMWRAVLKWAKNHAHMNADIPNYVVKKGRGNRRLAFSEDQYKKLTNYMRSKKWLKNGDGLGKQTKGKGSSGVSDKRLLRHRSQIREWVLLMCASGIRTGEALQMRWGDVVEHTTMNEFQVVHFFVQATHTKVSKRRPVIGMPEAAVALARLRKSREENEFDLVDGDYTASTDFIFCDTDGKRFSDLREGWHTLLEGAKVGLDLEGNRYTPYCSRHHFISSMIRRSTIDPYIIAKNCGTSMSMLDGYYDDTTPIDHVKQMTEGLPFYLRKENY